MEKHRLCHRMVWKFTKYGSIKACFLADELKILGFKYATQAGISISIEDLRVPFIKNKILQTANQEILNTEKFYLKGRNINNLNFTRINRVLKHAVCPARHTWMISLTEKLRNLFNAFVVIKLIMDFILYFPHWKFILEERSNFLCTWEFWLGILLENFIQLMNYSM